jgi:diaminohydroxyphosphoribosylaminopyrimidine deaminase/5-amino-6-(5-phosphoribosylamino)uracil reductase
MQYGGPHAEVNAINSVETQYHVSIGNEKQSIASILAESTLYVSLEPCSHHGKTPPCADLIIQHKIPRVVIASNDPNPLVAGKGIERLRAHGVDVITGVLKQEADFLNRRFMAYHTKQRPYIFLKWVSSSNGFMALAEPKQIWLSNAASKKLAHKWRSHEQAIMVGKNTVLVDNPLLTVREWQGKNPLRITIDKNLKLPQTLNLFNSEAPTLVFNAIENKQQNNIEWVKINFTADVEHQILHELYKRQIQSVIIEGGPALLNSFIAKNLWDEAQIFTTPHIIENGKPAPVVTGRLVDEVDIDGDKLVVVLNQQAV